MLSLISLYYVCTVFFFFTIGIQTLIKLAVRYPDNSLCFVSIESLRGYLFRTQSKIYGNISIINNLTPQNRHTCQQLSKYYYVHTFLLLHFHIHSTLYTSRSLYSVWYLCDSRVLCDYSSPDGGSPGNQYPIP